MPRSSIHRLAFIALALSALLAGVGPAYASSHAPVTRAALAALAARPAGLDAIGSVLPASVPPGTKVVDIPMSTGGKLRGYIPDGAFHVYHVPLYAGQNLTAHFGSLGPADGWELDLFNLNLQEAPLQSVYDGGQRAWINYDAQRLVRTDGPAEFDFGYDLVIFAPPGGGSYELYWDETDPSPGYSTYANRIAGDNRYATAAMGATLFQSPDTVVVATGVNFVDALAASSLCGSYDAPLLLTAPKVLSPATKGYVDGANPSRVFVIGSAKAVSDDVLNALKKTGRTVERVEGSNRFLTAVAIANKVHAHEIAMGRTPAEDAFIVNAYNYPDALSASPYAFAGRIPILLSALGSVPADTNGAITSLGITRPHIIGGYGSVSPAVESMLSTPAVDRISGSNRTATSSSLADLAFDNGWAAWHDVSVATGYNFPDGLAAGVFAGKKGGMLLLSKPQYMEEWTYTSLYAHGSQISSGDVNSKGATLVFWGSPTTLSGFVRGEGEEAISGVPW